MEEVWKDVVEYEGLYQVSNLGRIKSLKRINSYGRTVSEKILKPHPNIKSGYLCVNLYKNDKSTIMPIHRLVAITFIPNPDNLPQVGHKDETRTNNNVDNLEWVTNKETANTSKRKERLRKINMGKKISNDVKQKLSKTMSGIKGRKFMCNDIYFESATDLAKYLELPLGTFLHYANNERKIPETLPRFLELTQRGYEQNG